MNLQNDESRSYLSELIDRIKNKENVIFFIGAGLSLGSGLPSWEELVIWLSKEFEIDSEYLISDAHAEGKGQKLQTLAEKIENKVGDSRFVVKAITKHFDDIKPAYGYSLDFQRLLVRIVSRTSGIIFTTNYDALLEDAAEKEGIKCKVYSYPNLFSQDFKYITKPERKEGDGRLYIFKMHGSLENDQIVLSNSSYESAYRSQLISLLTILSEKNIFFLGCSFTDSYFGTLYRSTVGSGNWYTYYPVLSSTKKVENSNIKTQNIKLIGYRMNDMNSSIEHNNNIKNLFEYLIQALDITAAVKVYSLSDIKTIANNKSIKRVELTKDLLNIGDWKLEDLSAIEEVICCSEISNIPNKAFSNCKSLNKVIFKSDVVSIGDQAFDGCNRLKEIITPSGVNRFSNIERLGNMVFNKCEALEKLEFADTCRFTIVSPHCFQGCVKLAEIIFPSNIVEIGACAFKDCKLLKNFNFRIYKNLSAIRIKAFLNCDSLQVALLGDSVSIIEEGAFQECEQLQVVRIPKELKVISHYCFADCCSLESLTMMCDSKISTIEIHAFQRCIQLEHIEFPKTLEEIKAKAFLSCAKLNDVRFNSNPKIQNSAFDGCLGFKL